MSITETYVRPTSELVPETVTLSPFDQYNGRHYLPLFFTFEQADDSVSEEMVLELQEGLARLLDEAPFLAGTVSVDDETTDYLTLEITEDGGVPFKVRRMIDPDEGPALDYKEMERNDFPVDCLNPMIMCPRSFLPEAVAPCLMVQANLIKGGIILATHWHHSVVDGEGGMTLFSQWAKHTTAVAEGRVLSGDELMPPEAFDRTVLFSESKPRRQLCDFDTFEDGRKAVVEDSSCWNIADRMEVQGTEGAKLVKGVSWFFSEENLQRIEDKGMPSDPTLPKMTQSSILAALIFRHYTRARRLEQQGVTEASYHYPCNIRSRIEPQLHPRYVGNAVAPSRTLLPLTEICSTDEDSLYRMAAAISGTIDSWTSDKIWEFIGAMEAWPRVTEIERTMDLNCKTDLHITNLSGFPVMDSWWGPKMKKSTAFKLPAMALLDGYGLIMPRCRDGGLEVIIYMDVETLKILREDEEFMQYARFVCA